MTKKFNYFVIRKKINVNTNISLFSNIYFWKSESYALLLIDKDNIEDSILKVLHNLRSSEEPQMSEYIIVPEDDLNQDEEIIVMPYGETEIRLKS